MGLDWCIRAGKDGIEPAVKIGCRRFSRNDQSMVESFQAYADEMRADRTGEPETLGLMQALATLIVAFRAASEVTIGQVCAIALRLGLGTEAPQGDATQQVRPEEALRAAEWLFAALCRREDLDVYTLYWHVDPLFSIWRMDWRRPYLIETAQEQIPEGEGSFVAGPLSFRGKILQYCGLPRKVTQKLIEGGNAQWMWDIAGELRTCMRSMDSPTRKHDREQCDLAVKWLEFWAAKDVEVFAWY